jgi:hypothetical protein
MADEAFALSPISARPVMPSDADYDAIREAFMETSRGRWFLTEYAKRNRNADTHMVLDAVARIEQSLAAQKQASGSSLSESLVAIRAIVGEARANVAKAIVGLENTAVLAAAHEGARIIREVSWTLRECGADVRICNLLDSQVGAVEAGHRLVADLDSDAVLAAFDSLLDHIHDLAGAPRESTREAPPADSGDPAPFVSDGDLPEMAAAMVQDAPEIVEADAAVDADEPQAAAAEQPTEPALTIVIGERADELEFVEPQDDAAETDASFDHAQAAPDHSPLVAEAADVDAMLDLVAMEMSAPQPEEPNELEAAIAAAQAELAVEEGIANSEPSEIEQLAADVAVQHEPTDLDLLASDAAPSIDDEVFEIGERGEPLDTPDHAAEPAMIAHPTLEPVAATAPVTATRETAPVMAAAEASAPKPSPSLGAALLASGVVAHPGQPRSDTLAPLRRMSQAEKVAFFS